MKTELNNGGFGTASLVLGIISLVILGLPCGILAIIFGSIAISKQQKYGSAGLILGLIGTLTSILIIFMLFSSIFS